MWECYPIIIYIIYPMYCYNNILERRKLYVSVLRDIPFCPSACVASTY